MNQLIELLHQGGYSCVIKRGPDVRTFTQRGVADLYELLHQEPNFMSGALIADKVVGKGAAALMILGGIAQVHADVISQSALDLFRHTGVEVSYEQVVPFISNRDNSGWCPVEKLCLSAEGAEEALKLIEGFLKSLKIKNESN